MNNLSPLEIYSLVEYEKLRSFVELASNGKRPDGTYNYCREALEKKAQQLLEELKEIKQDGLRNLC
jgi:AAA+ ATPase superfamily predicted ATPase